MRVVVCGSYGDMKCFLGVLESYKQRYGEQRVFPDWEHLNRSIPCVEAHHGDKQETEEIIRIRSRLMKAYFTQIDHADLVVVVNEKNGEEYYGVGTTLQLGYAFAKAKRIHFARKPTNPNILSLFSGHEEIRSPSLVSQ